MRPSCSAARTGADPAPYSLTSSHSLVTTSGVKRMFSSVAGPVCVGSRQASLNRSGGRTAGGVCCIDETMPAMPKTRSTTAGNLKAVVSWLVLRRGFHAQQCSVVIISQQVQQTIRALPHFANTLPQFPQHRFAPDLFHLVVEDDALHVPRARNFTCAHGADKDTTFPLRKSVACVHGHSSNRDGRNPCD